MGDSEASKAAVLSLSQPFLRPARDTKEPTLINTACQCLNLALERRQAFSFVYITSPRPRPPLNNKKQDQRVPGQRSWLSTDLCQPLQHIQPTIPSTLLNSEHMQSPASSTTHPARPWPVLPVSIFNSFRGPHIRCCPQGFAGQANHSGRKFALEVSTSPLLFFIQGGEIATHDL